MASGYRWIRYLVLAMSAVGILCGMAPTVLAGDGPLGIDHRLHYDDSGIWNKAHQNQILFGTGLAIAAAALWEGNNNRFGHTMWQSGDAIALSLAADFTLSNVFQRVRPEDTANADRWFQGFGNTSFPSGHAMISAAAVTPIVLEYGNDHPWVWAMEAIPLYEGIARVKTRMHWQTDVLAGWAIGTALGFYAHSRKVPIWITVLPKGFAVGIYTRF
ncbi:MAG TPA: phosphatase PAP2 family protein [Gammaproteobacteria bacterium]|nr:phosphatase PAP2 family protein [Gammaproteobacteria bacterium]